MKVSDAGPPEWTPPTDDTGRALAGPATPSRDALQEWYAGREVSEPSAALRWVGHPRDELETLAARTPHCEDCAAARTAGIDALLDAMLRRRQA